MLNRYSLFFLIGFAAFVVVGLDGGATECLAGSQEGGATNEIWQDPFYTGPFGVRIWTDITGDHRVKGRFVELLPDKIVRLQRLDGQFLRIQFDLLSHADREFVTQITLK